MKMALIRHGHASDNQIDEQRKLSDQGKEQAYQTAHFLKLNNFEAQQLIHSPLIRAIETCQIIASASFPNIEISESKELRPLSSLSYWLNKIDLGKDNIALVGHNPFMSMFAEELTLQPIGLPTGGCLILEKSQETQYWKILNRNFH